MPTAQACGLFVDQLIGVNQLTHTKQQGRRVQHGQQVQRQKHPAASRPLPTLARMRVGVVGLGYVGLPLAVAFAEEGHEVVGLDADPRKIDALAEGRSYIEDVPSERLAALDGQAHAPPAATRT